MAAPKAFLVVGHSNWGKSRTIISLTNNKWRTKWFVVGKNRFFIKRMSNDDSPKSLFKFADLVDIGDKPYIIATLCPCFIGISDEKYMVKPKLTEEILSILSRKYCIYAFVLKNKWKSEVNVVDIEIEQLNKWCHDVLIIDSKDVKDKERAAQLKEYILKNI